MQYRSPSRNVRSVYDVLEAFPSERVCVDHLARMRWPNGEVCPNCGVVGRAYKVKLRFKCSYCKTFFSARKDTIFEESKVPLRKWFAAIFLFTSNRKGIPSTQLAREISVKQETAWFMLSRLRQVADNMAVEILKGIIEVDECFIGGKERNKHAKKKLHNNWMQGKTIVVGAVERNGAVITDRVPYRDRNSLQAFIMRRVYRGSTVYTDEHGAYKRLPQHKHKNTNHSIGQYVNGDVHTQTIESFWAIVKRAHKGIYHQWSQKHCDLYLREFELRWNLRRLPDGDRLDVFLQHVNGTRLTYEDLKHGQRKQLRKRKARQLRKGVTRRGRKKGTQRRRK
ncbi:MAG: IS1595 family transposase [Chloroflexi bacterium]|nr:IS1595 family transposase [Chloroflexota bacterium]